MATASPNPVTPTNHSPKGAVNASNLSSPRSRRSAGARGVSSPRAQFVRGVDSDSRVSSPSSNAAATTTSVAAVSAATASSSLSSSVHDQFLKPSSAGSPPNIAVRNAESFYSSSGINSSTDDSIGEAHPENTEIGGGSSNAAKKQAWSKPSSSAAEVGAVMGASSWPALSESKKASPKSSSDSPSALADGPVSASKESGVASKHRQAVNNSASPISTSTHAGPMRQRSMKRGGGSSSNSVTENGGFPHPQTPPSPNGSVMEVESSNSGKMVKAAAESSSRENAHGVGGQRGYFGSQVYSGNEHQQRNTFSRRGNGGPHPRGDASYNHSHGGRRDQDRGNQDWNPHRSFVMRDAHVQLQRAPPRSFMRSPSHNSAPFIPPPMPVRPFGNPMIYHEVPSSLIYVPGPPIDPLSPMVAPMQPPHAMYFHVPDPQLHAKIVNQVEYYFSNENLIKDIYLRQNMDDQGWVSIELLAGFKKVMQLTHNIQLILDALQTSTVVEVRDYKVRKKNDWMKWIMSPSLQFSPVSSPRSLGRSSLDDVLATHVTHLQNVALDESVMHGHHYESYLSRSSSSESNNQGQQSGGDAAAQATEHVGHEDSISTGN